MYNPLHQNPLKRSHPFKKNGWLKKKIKIKKPFTNNLNITLLYFSKKDMSSNLNNQRRRCPNLQTQKTFLEETGKTKVSPLFVGNSNSSQVKADFIQKWIKWQKDYFNYEKRAIITIFVTSVEKRERDREKKKIKKKEILRFLFKFFIFY